METLTNQNSQTRYKDPSPNIICCPQCGIAWVRAYVPEFCPECGSRVSYKAGTGMEDMVEVIEEGKLPVNIIQCPNCKLRYPQLSKLKNCFRCQTQLVNTTPIRNILRKVLWHSRPIRKILRGQF